jgi:hypothetical protein
VFSPIGYVVMAFGNETEAEDARNALFRSGYREDEVTHYNRDEVMAEFEESEQRATSPVQMGQEVAKVEEYLELARQGAGFLVVHAPDDEVARRAVRIVKKFGLKFAEKYNQLTLEELA